MFDIRPICAADTYSLRHEILRPNQSIEQCRWQSDDIATTSHFGAFSSGVLVGILSLYKTQHPVHQVLGSYQLRGMATSKCVRGKGYAKKLLLAAEEHALGNRGLFIWANARILALGFYQKMNYAAYGDQFMIERIGIHQVVGKSLK